MPAYYVDNSTITSDSILITVDNLRSIYSVDTIIITADSIITTDMDS